jgi:hypothetical protein
MADVLLTVSDLVDCIQRDGENHTTVADRIKGWAQEGLLQLLGERNPGTGSRRTYSAQAVSDVLILTALNDWRIPATKYRDFIDQGRLAIEEARERHPKPVYLVIVREGKETPEQIASIRYDEQFPSQSMESALILNITLMLERLLPREAALREKLLLREQGTRKKRIPEKVADGGFIDSPTADTTGNGSLDANPGQRVADDLLWGVDAIAKEIGQPVRQVYRKLEQGQLPAGKSGSIWIASRQRLREHFHKLTAGQ